MPESTSAEYYLQMKKQQQQTDSENKQILKTSNNNKNTETSSSNKKIRISSKDEKWQKILEYEQMKSSKRVRELEMLAYKERLHAENLKKILQRLKREFKNSI